MWSRLFRLSVDLDTSSGSGSSESSASSTSSTASDGLPASRYRHTNWSDLSSTSEVVKGDQLKCPRVRQAPLPGDSSYEGRPPEARPLSRDVHLRSDETVVVRRLNEELSFSENWEEAIDVNLSYQNLGDPYQKANFKRIMKRLSRCQRLQLIDNHIENLSGFSLPVCVYLNLTKNHIRSFKQLPKLAMILHICLSENAIESLDGLKSALGSTQITKLQLKGNPVVFIPKYRKSVFSVLPTLQVLDGIGKRQCDCEPQTGGKRSGNGTDDSD
eukprot:scpid50805/ scgid10021/ U2 small nuclear ribonucleoprotein A&apos